MRVPLLVASGVLCSSALTAQSDTSRPAQPLPTVSVSAEKPVIAEFEARRLAGFGHFITRDDLAKQENRRTGDILSKVPGVWMVRGRGSYAWLANNRGQSTIINHPSVNEDDIRRGAQKRTCYAHVYLDGSPIYTGAPGQALVDVNQISPNQLEGIEYYAGGSQIPARFNRTGSTCGVLVLWTRRSP